MDECKFALKAMLALSVLLGIILQYRCLDGSKQKVPLEKITAQCKETLGMESGKITDGQITGFSAFGDDFNTYGAQRARLHLNTWPKGHRGNPAKASSTWLKIEFKEKMIITGIATQGYGDAKVGEWVKQYMLLYSTGKDYLYFKEQNGDMKMFTGNSNGNSVKRNEVPIPTVVKSIMLMPTDYQNNFALRMELYGCKPGYYFIVSLMVVKTYFTTDYLNFDASIYKNTKDDTELEVNYALESIPGFLGAKLIRFGPEKTKYGEMNLVAEVNIDCIEASVHYITTALKTSITQTAGMFDSSFMTVQYPLDVSCRPPILTINLNKTIEDAFVLFTTESILLKVDAEFRCNSTNHSLFNWEISQVSPVTSQLLSPLLLGLGKTQFTVAEKKLHVGIHYVKVIASMASEEGTATYDYGFINVTLPPLVAHINGPKEVVKGTGSINLDATRSFDPHDPLSKNKDMTFVWLCRRIDESFDNVNMSNYIDVISSQPRDKKGCFGYGPGRMNVTGPILEVNPSLMVSKHVYVFQVAVMKDTRVKKIEHELRVNSSIQITLRCVVNCGEKVSTNLRMTLESICRGLTCKTIQRYSWVLYMIDPWGDDPDWQEVTDVERRVLTDLDSPSFVLTGKLDEIENSLEDDTEYKLKVVLHLPDGSTESESIKFVTNSAPYTEGEMDDGCYVTPETGSAVTTEFHVNCKGFIDEDLPLQYEFRYHTNTGMVVIEKTSYSNMTTRLPLGDSAVDYFIAIEVLISDSLGAATMDFVPVTVKPMADKDVSGTLKSMTSGQGSVMGNLMKSGDVGKAAQMAYAVLSLVDQSAGSIDEGDRKSVNNLRAQLKVSKDVVKKLKEGIINQITKIKVKSLSQVTQVAAVIALATGQKDEISQESQENAVNLLSNTANFMASQKNDNPELMQKVGASLLHGIGNLMSAASSEAVATETDDSPQHRGKKPNESETKKQQKGKEMAEKTIKMMDVVAGSLLGTKTVGEKPSVFKTKSLALLLDRQMPSKMGSKPLGEGETQVALPSASTLFGESADNMPAVDSQMTAFKDNPFTWDESSKNVKSSVVEFTLKSTDGKALEVNGLAKPIELFIPQKIEEKPKNANDTTDDYFAKPSKGTKNIRSHQITIPSEDVAVSVKIKPQDNVTLDVFIRRLKKPTPEIYDTKTVIPDYSSCMNFSEVSGHYNCTDDPYTLTLSSATTGGIGVHYIGIRYLPPQTAPPTDPAAAEGTLARARRDADCYSHNGRMERGCVGVKDPPTTIAPTPFIIIPIYNSTTDVNYTMAVSVTGCLYWSDKKSKWTSEGCKVGPKSVAGKLHCLCTHLSAFGGDFFVAPNPIDFDKVFAAFGNLAETGNFVVLSVVCGLIGLYIVGLVFARKADKRDETKVVANVVLNEEDLEEGYHYQISIQTGMWRGYGTTANVGIIVYGEDGKSEEIMLTDKNLKKNFFARGSLNNFTVVLSEPLGDLLKIKIWHDNSGPSPAWFFHQVLIVDVQTAEQCHFLANRWLAVEKGDGQIELEIPKAEKKDLSGFANIFYSRTAKSLGEGHIWLSVFTRPPHNTFTRCQRMSCCLCILFTAMVTNAMFYQFGGSPKDSFQIGPLKMSWTQIKIGIQSSIVAIPINVLIVTIFRKVKHKALADDTDSTGGGKTEKKKAPGCLPHFFVYIAWILSTLTSLASATFTVFYSLMWGADTSNQWLTSIMVSFFQDVIITQPIKVVAIASLLSLVLKKPPENDVVIGESLSKETKDGDENGCVAPRGKELEKQREYQKKVIEMFRTMVEIIFFVIFILLIVVVCYGNRKASRYHLTEGMEKLCSGFEKVTSPEKFWEWTKVKLLPALYDTEWYNEEPFLPFEGYISNREAFIVGMPRLRQLRLLPDPNCIVEKNHPRLSHMFKRCLPLYTHVKEDMTEFSMPGWKPVHNLNKTMSLFKLHDMCPKPWRYKSAKSLNSLSFQGLSLSYDGGGYVADLGYNQWQAAEVIKNLESNDWIDDMTAAVLVEMTVFEPSSSLFSHIKYLYERFRTGGTNVHTTIKTLVLYSSSDQNFQSFFQVCQLMLMLMILFFLFVEIGKIYRQGRNYVKQFWNWMELIQISSTVASIVMFFLKEQYTSDFVKNVQDNPYETSSIDYIVMWSDLEIYLLAMVIFVVTIKFLRLIRFNRSVCQMTGTLVRSAKNISSFFIIFVAVLLAFTQLGFLAFGATVTAYSSFFQSLRSVLQMLLGGEMHFYELQTTDPFIGPAFTFVYMLSMTMILLNMFLAILNESYEETKESSSDEDFADADLCEFMTGYFRNSFHQFTREVGIISKKLVTVIVQTLLSRRNQKKEEEYLMLQAEEPKETNLFEESEVDVDPPSKEVSKIYLASVETFDDLFSDEYFSLEDIQSSITDLRKSLISLQPPEEQHILVSLPTELLIESSPKWDSPSIQVETVANPNEPSIFDAPPSYQECTSIFSRQARPPASLFDRQTGPPSSLFERPQYDFMTGRYSPFSSSRAIDRAGTNRGSRFLSPDDEDDCSSVNENTRLLGTKSPTTDTTTTSVAESEDYK